MKITGSSLQLTSTSERRERTSLAVATKTVERTLERGALHERAQGAARGPDRAREAAGTTTPSARLVGERPSPHRPAQPATAATDSARQVEEAVEEERSLTPTLRLLKDLLDRFFGVAVELFDPKRLETEPEGVLPAETPANTRADDAVWIERTTVLEATATVVKAEALTFSASGIVRTADGRTIEFAAGFALAREERVSLSVTLGVLEQSIERRRKDPLVIDLAGTGAELVDIGFRFDLFGNGQTINLPAPARGLGFLVFDRNGNGRVDDGHELFGPATGDGFAELAALDEDRNGWIDEGDRAFGALYVWHPFAPDRLIALKEANIGALATTAAATPWMVGNQLGETAGQMQKTSVYLKESGGVGTLSHLDLEV